VLLFGGVFDPPHKAHTDLPRRIREHLVEPQAWLVYVPAAQSPHKPGGPEATDRDRLAMLRAATRDLPRCMIWTDEIDRGGPSYWVQTLERAASTLPKGAQLRFIIGSDQAAAFHRWRRFRDILSIAQPVVMVRPPHKDAAGVIRAMRRAGEWTNDELDQWASWIADGPTMKASSTQIRAGSRRDLAAPVRAYIRRHSLYSRKVSARPS
jgi:nicotinate-nucleotide adenylyltransferase